MAGFAVAAMLLAMDAGSAAARKLSGTHSFGEVAAACGAAHGAFGVSPSGGYNCTTTGGTIACDSKGSCYGGCGTKKCPALARGNINAILRPPSAVGTTSAAGGTPKPKPPPVSKVNDPVVERPGSHPPKH